MNQNELIAMAKEARISEMGLNIDGSIHLLGLFERFAVLVAAAEREACARLIEGMTERKRWLRGGINGEATKPCEYAAALRARSKP